MTKYTRKDTSPAIYVRYALWHLLCRHVELRTLLMMDGGHRYTFPHMRRDFPKLLAELRHGDDPLYAAIVMRDYRDHDGMLDWALLRRHARSAELHIADPQARTRRPHRPQDWDRYLRWARLRYDAAAPLAAPPTGVLPADPAETTPDLLDVDAFFAASQAETADA